MKKQLLVAALVMGSFFTANAQQTTVLNQDFEDVETLGDWLLFDADGDGGVWQYLEGDATTDEWGTSGNFLGSFSWSSTAGPLTPDNYLLSEIVSIPAGQPANVNFLVGVTYYSEADGDPENMSVYALPITDPEADVTLEQLEALTPLYNEQYADDYVQTATLKTVDLSAYAGQDVRIVFRHHDSSNQELLYIDNVMVMSGTAGVNNALASQFSVFPNPANNVVTIANADNNLVTGVSLVDINGRTVKSVKFDGVSNAQINVSDLASGMYIMNISSAQGTVTKKIVKN